MNNMLEQIFYSPVVIVPILAFLSYLAYLIAKNIGFFVIKKIFGERAEEVKKIKQIDGISTALLRIEAIILSNQDSLDELQKQFILINSQLSRHEEKINDLQKTLYDTSNEVNSIKTRVAVIESKKEILYN